MGDVQVSNGKREHNKMQREKEISICMSKSGFTDSQKNSISFFQNHCT